MISVSSFLLEFTVVLGTIEHIGTRMEFIHLSDSLMWITFSAHCPELSFCPINTGEVSN